MDIVTITPRHADLGHGLIVQRLLPSAQQRMVGPFVFLDHAGPVQLAPAEGRQADIRPHPHIGLSTVSYLFGGRMVHRDSLGIEQVIAPGDVNWMTAGRGIVHSERFDHPQAFADQGLELLQTWVALPESDEEIEPDFSHHAEQSLPTATESGATLRVILGEAYGLRSPVPVRSPMFYVHADLSAGARAAVPAGAAERALYVAHGSVELGSVSLPAGHLAILPAGLDGTMRATEDSQVMFLGGEPLGPRHLWWNFVSSRRERIEQAKADWQAGRFTLPPNDDAEFIPLP